MLSISKPIKLVIAIISFILMLSLFKSVCLVDYTLIELSPLYAKLLLVLVIPLGLLKLFELIFFVIRWFTKNWSGNNNAR
ncbi:Uncharacterised protein [Serratia fonticola]|nr:Uncharacterised protein [Serratia fonticola]